MVGWYDPRQLLRTAPKVAVSTLFGRHADFRLIEALATTPVSIEDHSKIDDGKTFWLDYTADVGDGWNPTYAVAYALAQPQPTLHDASGAEHLTYRGAVLVFGGDEVYPVATRRVPRRWKPVSAADSVSAMAPDDRHATAPALIEPPIRLRISPRFTRCGLIGNREEPK